MRQATGDEGNENVPSLPRHEERQHQEVQDREAHREGCAGSEEKMSLYNALFGFSPACVFIMPMLGRKQDEWPRFRDCHITDDNNIAIYTRVGGNNRNCGYGEEKLYKDENFIRTYDDDFDDTYATYEFKVPERWKDDFEKLTNGHAEDVSDEYVAMLEDFFPKLAESGTLKKILRPSEHEEVEEQDG